LVILGDSEELWECSPKSVLQHYKDSFIFELKFLYKQKYYRIYGNHDNLWKKHGEFIKYLKKHGCINNTIPSIPVYQGLIFDYENNGKIFLVHGHQGNFSSDIFSKISKLFVCFIYRNIQRLFKIKTTTPARDISLAGEHNIIMYKWALQKAKEGKKIILIAGHTHRPVFASVNHLGKVVSRLINLIKKMKESRKRNGQIDYLIPEFLESFLEYELLKSRGKGPPMLMEVPCYFNTGCCSYSDGDITGIEISEGEIKLIKFSCNGELPEVLERRELENIFKDISFCSH